MHIAAKLLGHKNVNTTQTYVAVFDEHLVRAYRAFLDNRRASARKPNTAIPPIRNGASSSSTSSCANSNWAPAHAPTAVPAGMSTPVSLNYW
ncbi:hypothetical protein AB0H00_31085 [Nocardia sp. NPDC023852]|uniref:hypothetical protein n=1 Tax=Nocardia sp. NPDC023852 TaxID=3154697 RepID=UPI0033FE4F66